MSHPDLDFGGSSPSPIKVAHDKKKKRLKSTIQNLTIRLGWQDKIRPGTEMCHDLDHILYKYIFKSIVGMVGSQSNECQATGTWQCVS